jgi:hypothetical protein
MTLKQGFMTEVNRPEPQRLQRVFFKTNFVRVRGIGNDLERNTMGGEKSDRERTVCELQAQLRNAVRQRDSIFAGMKSLDPKSARAIGNPNVAGGSGDAYCRMVRMFRVKTAQAAEVAVVAGRVAQAGQAAGQAGQASATATRCRSMVRTSSMRAPLRCDAATAMSWKTGLDTGEILIRELLNNPAYGYAPIGFIDDDDAKVGRKIQGFPIHGRRR